MTIKWKQTAWNTPKGSKEKRAYKWEGKRPDGRSFRITLIQRLNEYHVYSFNGTKLGMGKSLSEAQNICERAPAASTVGVKQQPAPVQVAAG